MAPRISDQTATAIAVAAVALLVTALAIGTTRYSCNTQNKTTILAWTGDYSQLRRRDDDVIMMSPRGRRQRNESDEPEPEVVGRRHGGVTRSRGAT